MTIEDDETATVEVSAASSATADEIASNLPVTVKLVTSPTDATLSASATVNVANSGGTTLAGTDYTAVSTTVTFNAASANNATQTVNIPVLADKLVEGNETGTYAAAVNYAAGSAPRSVAIGDLDRDGDLDLAVANQGSANVSVLLGD